MLTHEGALAVQQIWGEWFGKNAPMGSFVGDGLLTGSHDLIDLEDPSDGHALASYADAGAEGALAAVDAAEAAGSAWRGVSAADRGRLLWAMATRVRTEQEMLARLESITTGKPLRDTSAEVTKVAEMFEYYAGWADKQHGELIPVPTSHLNYTVREPYGIVAAITPWNAPLFTAGWNLAPALAAGNTVVVKPSELTPLSTVVLARLAVDAGIPAGTINVVAGLGGTAGQAIVSHPLVDKVVFVGSPTTGRRIAETAASQLTPCVLELGGKSANIVFMDADIGRAVGGAAAAIYSAAGQSCVAGSRLLVQRQRYDEVVDGLARLTETIHVGHPLHAGTQMGPLQNRAQFGRVEQLVDDAVQHSGLTRMTGGRLEGITAELAGGFYYAPTLLRDATNDMPISREEVFGPVVTAIPFEDEDEAIAIANDSRFGLAGAVWTGDNGRAHRVASQLQAGTIWINSYKTIGVMSPFGGFKDSGYGRSSGREGLMEYTQVKSVWTETAAHPAMPFGYGV